MRGRKFLRPLMALSLSLFAAGILKAGAEGNPSQETPSSASVVKLGAGSVDAVTGNLSLRVPLGPRLPGRIPIGFSWNFSSGDGVQNLIGGNFRPVVWPSPAFGDSPLQTTVMVNGQAEVFYRHYSTTAMPSISTLLSALAARGFAPPFAGGGVFNAQAIPSSDGTKFLIYYWYANSAGVPQQVGSGYAILDGADAIWTQQTFQSNSISPSTRTTVTHFTNRWGDHVTSTDTEAVLSTANGNFWRLTQIVLANQNRTSQTLTLTPTYSSTRISGTRSAVDGNGAVETCPAVISEPATIEVTNTLGLPVVDLTGEYTAQQRFKPTIAYGCSGYSSEQGVTPEGLWDHGFCPSSIVSTASNQESRTMTMDWPEDNYTAPVLPPGSGVYNYSPMMKDPRSLLYPNGMKETLSYGYYDNFSNASYSLCTGLWDGYHVVQPGPSTLMDGPEPSSPSGVAQVVRQDMGVGGTAETYVFLREVPQLNGVHNGPPGGGTTTYTCIQPNHVTAILHYGSASPSGPYRAIRLTHPSYTSAYDPNNDTASVNDPNCYLFASSATLYQEVVMGSGTPTTPEGITGHTVKVTAYDGFDLRNWANPTGSLTSGLPVSAIALRTKEYTENLPTKITVSGNPNTAGARDAYGPLLTDEYTDAPATFPTVSGDASAVIWSDGLPASESHSFHRRGTVTRQPDFSSATPTMRVLTQMDHKTLDGSALPAQRFAFANSGSPAPPSSGLSSVDFGTTNYGYDGQGLIQTQTGVRTDPTGSGATFTATETRIYLPGLPLINETTKSLTATGTSQSSFPGSGQTGEIYTWQDTLVQGGPSTVQDKVDGRTATFFYNAMGEETSRTDVLGVTTATTYDAWNQVHTVTRQAVGGIGAVTTTTTLTPDLLHKTVAITADGKTLSTQTDFDAFGRTTKVTAFDANGQVVSTQAFQYDGFGQKTAQSPVLLAGQTSWGYETWTYDDEGRVTGHYDRVPNPASPTAGRQLSVTLEQPEYATKAVEGISIAGIWTTTQDDRGFTRSLATDLLGQRLAVVDQAGQLSRYFYDADGHLLQTLQGNQQRSYTYNAMGWLTRRMEPEEGETDYSSFTLAGTPLVTQQVRPSGTRTFTTVLDAHLQPSQITATGPEGTVTRILSYDYSATNTHLLTHLNETQAIVGLSSQALSEAYGYDALGRLLSKTVSDGDDGFTGNPNTVTQAFTVSQTLNDGGQVTSLTYPAGGGKASQTSTIAYDAQNRPLTVKLDGALRGMMTYGTPNQTAVTDTLILGNGAQTVSRTDKGELVESEHLATAGVIEDNAMTWTAGGLMLTRGSDSFAYDPLQRLSHSLVHGVYGETVEQWYTYDRFGNRTQNNFQYTAAGASTQPSEVLAWSGAYGAGNQLSTTLTALAPGAPGSTATGSLATGVQYDDLGRMTQVWTTPGQASTQTTWIYDPSGRVMKENGTTYLLEASGLRFKRTRLDGTVDYTVYGFGREPLAQFEIPAPPKTQTATRTFSTQTTAQPMIGGQGAGAYILQPSGPITVAPGQAISFQGDTDFGTSFTWTFGDGGTASTMSTTHVFTTVGTYTVSFKAAANGYTASTATVVITVMAKPSITSFTASPSSITSGQSSTLAWAVTGATSLSLDNGIGTVTGTSRSVSPSVSTTYTLTATNAAGSVTATVTVAVSAPAPPTIVSFTAIPSTIAAGSSTNLAWNVTGGASISISGLGAQTGNSVAVSPSTTTSYTLSATNAAGTTTATITVTVETQLPTITDFWANPYQISSGQSTTLNWAASLADSVKLNGTTVTGSSSSVSPTATTTYTLTATNLLGSVTATVTVSVGAPGALVWKKTIVYGFGQELAEDQPGMGTTFIQSDFVGSPSVMTDASGTVIGRSKNLPFGERLTSWGQKTIRRYTNHEDDADSGAIYMQAREQLPAYGQFAQVDPAYDQTKDDPESWNLYNYVTNNPVTHTDPDGRIAFGVDPEYAANVQQVDAFTYQGQNLAASYFDTDPSIEGTFVQVTYPYGPDPSQIQQQVTGAQDDKQDGTQSTTPKAHTTNAPVTDATKNRTSIINSLEDLPAGARVLLVTGYTNSTPDDGYQAAANFMAANKGYSGPVAVVLNDHDLNGITMNKATGGNFDPPLDRLVESVARKMLANADGGPVSFIAHSDGTSTLDRALGNMGKMLSSFSNLKINYFGSPQLWSAADHAVHWTVRNGDPVTWLGSFWRFGASDTTRISGWGHSFANYMNDAGGVW